MRDYSEIARKISKAAKKNRAKKFLGVEEEIKRLYANGAGASGIGKKFNRTADAVRGFLQDLGVKLRSRSEQELMKWSKLKHDRAAVERQCAAAWKKNIGLKYSDKTLMKKAEARFHKAIATGRYKYDGALNAEIQSRFEAGQCLYQWAFDKYNVDFFFHECGIAVEVYFGTVQPKGFISSLDRSRVKKILNAGYHLLIYRAKKPYDIKKVADDLVSYVQIFGSFPSVKGKYRVVSSTRRYQLAIAKHLKGIPSVKRSDNFSSTNGPDSLKGK